MLTFKDTATGLFWQFNDDVLVTGTDGARYFNAPHGASLSVPVTLVPAELPPPVDPPAPIPQTVSRYQGREAMRLTPYGNPEDGVSLFDAAVALLALPETPAYYVRAWEELQSFEHDSPMLTAVADELGLTSEDLGALFLFAASLRA
ncbi:hypothetical protein [Achromobacter sp.]|uniref:hypothetical protein n=1 Tax=Achromobacter sp. TaxID=134375 RepID=UPI002F933EEE